MSVIKAKRGESGVQFLETARQLQIFTIKQCLKIPKRYTFYLGTRISDIAARVYEYAKKGNSIYPSNPHEVQMRRDYFLQARAECESLVAQINIVIEFCDFSEASLIEWMRLIDNELITLRGILNKDKERFE